MRALLFLAVLGVVGRSASILDSDNPPAAAFSFALDDAGVRIFGVILQAVSIPCGLTQETRAPATRAMVLGGPVIMLRVFGFPAFAFDLDAVRTRYAFAAQLPIDGAGDGRHEAS